MGPWSFGSHPLIDNPWSTEVLLEKEGVKAIPISMKLHQLLLHLWSPEMLSRIASFVVVPAILATLLAKCSDLPIGVTV
ncbi:hypothetical protein RJ640_025883 [Escallonia rubra]|uniref:Uncharacterized protein n=1 Tax=Escallonia rubra TaxID=112253 RepID=A0AA88RTC8_9ASTE|nr:hypothetical protein RJ640_025883 [Escallonia rubra]